MITALVTASIADGLLSKVSRPIQAVFAPSVPCAFRAASCPVQRRSFRMFPSMAHGAGRLQKLPPEAGGTRPARQQTAHSARGMTCDPAAAAAATVALVLDEDAPLPDTAQDIEDLVHRLRGHVPQLGAAVPSGSPLLRKALQMSATPLPDGYLASRVHLVHLAEATQSLTETARRSTQAGPRASAKGRWKRPSRNAVRIAMFVLVLVTLVIAASVPQAPAARMTTGGAVLIALIVSAMAFLIVLGQRSSHPSSPDSAGDGCLPIPRSPDPGFRLPHTRPSGPADEFPFCRERAMENQTR